MANLKLLKHKKEIEEFVKLGYKDNKISELLQIPVASIGKFRRRHNIPRGLRKIENLIMQLHNEGKTFSEIGRILNIPDTSIAYNAKKMNLKPNWTKRSYLTTNDRIKGYMIRNVKYSAKRKNMEFNLSYKDLILPEVCPLLKIPLNYNSNFEDISYPTVDRIDNTKGYIKGNVWVISRLANSMKNSATFDQLNTFCDNIQILLKNREALGNITDIFQIKEISEK